MTCTNQGRPARAAWALCALAALPIPAAGQSAGQHAASQGRLWSSALLRQAAPWTERMNDALVQAGPGGLRVEIASGRTWAIAGAPSIAVPRNAQAVRVHATALTRGKWLMRLWGDLRGDGKMVTTGLFEAMASAGAATVPIDPRMVGGRGDTPIMVQLGIEGEPGGSVLFEAVEFVPGPGPATPRRIAGQRSIQAVDLMPNLPKPYKMIDWRGKARAYDRFVFDFNARGEFLPLIWLDESRVNIDRATFGLPSYVGDDRERGGWQESITCMGAVLGATIAGVDKRKQEHDYVAMCEAFFSSRNGQNVVLNNQNQGTGGSFWYELWPSIVFYALADRYPGTASMDAIVRTSANRWRDAIEALRGDFDHTAFDLGKMQPVDNGQWKEPDAAAGLAWIEYTAWKRFGDRKHLDAAEQCMRFLDQREKNPYYEVLMPWGTLIAARMNAEMGRHYDVDKMLNWCFGISDCRGGWGVVLGNWGGYDCAGLAGSVDNRGGYAFAMNTFAEAGALVPLVRYDARYARAIGKWMLNLANAARLFYPNETPNQCCGFWKGDPQGAIAYEGLRYAWQGKSPCATGDPVEMKWGPKTDRGLYGSGYVGFLGGIVRKTNVTGILQLDCLATDFYRDRAYPTYLLYNPHAAAKTVTIDVGARPSRLYDAATHRTLKTGARGRTPVTIAPDTAIVLVVAPANAKAEKSGGKLRVGGVVVDYRL